MVLRRELMTHGFPTKALYFKQMYRKKRKMTSQTLVIEVDKILVWLLCIASELFVRNPQLRSPILLFLPFTLLPRQAK